MNVTALLGPTNTGKTHRAIERMLEFDTGMIGLPLRLLAREVYDRLSTKVGEQAVALVTGEEKRVPPRARYWVCTVEAMPLELEVDFVAVDEIQLTAHPERGHVFTDRLLHLRGRAETWFMGADTVEGLLRTHLPLARVRKQPRFSQLKYTGQSSLRSLPRRSAVVAFSLPQVYELADILRVRRGGAAVVLGALSPRVRNAQVALYQAGEVDFLVATDAIGMGLNLDIDHVALASRSKFDGFERRELELGELAQIAGRAGRYLRDGTFGVLSPEPELSPRVVEQLEQHQFPAQRFLYYRNSNLDYTRLDTLLNSLEKQPRGFGLRAAPEGDDLAVLRVLTAKPELRAMASSEERVLLLWELCRIPNYEKRLPEHQAERIVPLYRELLTHGVLSRALLDAELNKLERYQGDIHVLMDRLAAIRTWSYVSQKRAWLPDGDWHERTRAIEDKLGDVLHEQLLERFVSTSGGRRRPRASNTQLARDDKKSAQGPFAKLASLSLVPGAVEVEPTDFFERLIAAPYEQLTLSSQGHVLFEGEKVAKLVAGAQLLHPQLKLLLDDVLGSGVRSRIERRLLAHARDVVADLAGALRIPGALSAPLRGLLYQLEQGLGTVQRSACDRELSALNEDERALLATHDIIVGQRTVFARALLNSDRLRVRRVLVTLLVPQVAAIQSDLDQVAAVRDLPQLPREALLQLGFVRLSRWSVRCDVLQMIDALRASVNDHAQRLAQIGALLGEGQEQTEELMRELVRRKKRRKTSEAGR